MASLASPIISGIGSILGGILGSSASRTAAGDIQAGLGQSAGAVNKYLDLANSQLYNGTQNSLGYLSPFQSEGAGAAGTLSQMLGTPGQGLLTPWTSTFQAPTAEQAAQTPGYQFQLQQGENAVQGSAAARGGLLSGQTLADMNNYAQGTASTNYQNTFNNALTQYQSAYQSFLNNQSNTYNMLAGQAGMGLQAGQAMGNLNQMGTEAMAGNTMATGSDLASIASQGGAAKAGGALGSAQSWMNALGGATNSLSSIPWGNMGQMNPYTSTGPLAGTGGWASNGAFG